MTKKIKITNPAVIYPTLYISEEIESIEHYVDVCRILQNNTLQFRDLIVKESIIPKYFQLSSTSNVYDLASLIAPLNLKKIKNVLVVTDSLDTEENIELDYAHSLTLQSTKIAPRLSKQHNDNLNPLTITFENSAYIHKNEFYINTNPPTSLAKFSNEFPRTCVFAMPFVLLGNQNPLAKFHKKIDDIILSNSIDDYISDILESDTVILLALDDLTNADFYSDDVKNQQFISDLEIALEKDQQTIVKLGFNPVFIANQEIRIPFLTFDMYTNIFNHSDIYYVDVTYHNYLMQLETIKDNISTLGLEYQLVLGERIDFYVEKELENSLITKIMNREVIRDLYLEQSHHDIAEHSKDIASIEVFSVDLYGYNMIILIGKDRENNIIQQVNAYILEENSNLCKNDILTFFKVSETTPIVMHSETTDFSYCPIHLKINCPSEENFDDE